MEGISNGALPPPPQTAPAPGTEKPNNDYPNGTTTSSHMPPPPLPQIMTSHTNVMGGLPSAGLGAPGSQDLMSPGGGMVRRAAPEPNKRALYIGGLDPRVTEDVLRQIFETTGHVQSVKIIPDKSGKGVNYGFVEYDDPAAAERALSSLNGRRIHQSEIKVNWAYQSNTTNKEDTSGHAHIFVGDLSNEVNDETLLQAFAAFGTVSEARVMWDMKTGRSRGYGFVSYADHNEAEKALNTMNGEWLGSRAIRCNWANQKGQPSMGQQQSLAVLGMTPTTPFTPQHHQFPVAGAGSYHTILAQTPQWQTTCYIGNLTPYTTQNDLIPLFQNFGYVMECRVQSDRGFAFIKMDTHENAANAICHLQGYNVNGRPMKCSWGKDRQPGSTDPFSPQMPQTPGFAPQSAGGYGYPQYGATPISPHAPQSATMPFSPVAQSPQAMVGPGGYPQTAGAFPPSAYPQQQQPQYPQQHQVQGMGYQQHQQQQTHQYPNQQQHAGYPQQQQQGAYRTGSYGY